MEGEGGAPAVGGGVPATAAGQEGVAVDLGADAQVGGVGLGEREVEQGRGAWSASGRDPRRGWRAGCRGGGRLRLEIFERGEEVVAVAEGEVEVDAALLGDRLLQRALAGEGEKQADAVGEDELFVEGDDAVVIEALEQRALGLEALVLVGAEADLEGVVLVVTDDLEDAGGGALTEHSLDPQAVAEVVAALGLER